MLSEKLLMLRKKRGLSQEQLAEQLQVSRQAISKWETGSSVPESDKLLAISEYFGVTLDYLMKEEADPGSMPEEPTQPESRKEVILGVAVCIAGVFGLISWGLIFLLHPPMANQIQESSAIRIDGNGIFLLICVGIIAIGAGFLFKGRK